MNFYKLLQSNVVAYSPAPTGQRKASGKARLVGSGTAGIYINKINRSGRITGFSSN